MKNLFDKDFPSPQPIINNNGNYITEIVKKKAAVISFLEGSAKLQEYCGMDIFSVISYDE